MTMNELKVFIPEQKGLLIPDKPIRTIGIDLGTTNSTVAEAIFDPKNPDAIKVRCLDVDQVTEMGTDTDFLVPSVVTLTGEKVWIGKGAKLLRSKMMERKLVRNKTVFYECKNEMGIRRIYNATEDFQSPARISGHILKFLLRAAQEENDIPIQRTVVTVPASFQASQRNDTLEAARFAGIDIQGGDFLDEPIAAFIDYILSWGEKSLGEPGESKNLVVFDFGGGTCDVATFTIHVPDRGEQLKIATLSVSRYHRLGGGDIDLTIFHEVLIPQIIEQNNLQKNDLTFDDKHLVLAPTFLSVAEALKIGLCMEIATLKQFGKYDGADKNEIYSQLNQIFPSPRSPLQLEEGLAITLSSPRLTAKQFEKVLEPFLDEDYLYAREDQYRMTCSIFAPLEDAVDRSGLKISDIDYVLLFGGSCLIPHVVEAVETFFNGAKLLSFPDKTSIQTAVARGAAYHSLALGLFQRGLVEPVCNEDICIRTKAGLSELIPRRAPVPYPDEENWAENRTLVVPETRFGEILPLRVEIVDSEERQLFCKVWNITSLVNKDDPIVLQYRMDENQVLHLRMYLAKDKSMGVFEESIENPLTIVVNPEPKRLKILEIEDELQKRKAMPKDLRIQKMEMAADLYKELGDKEKALAILKRVLKGRNGKDVETLNKMGILCGSMGDYKRQVKFYKEAARVSSWSGSLFNLALAQREHDETANAVESVNIAIGRERSAPYLVLRAMLAEDENDNKTREKSLEKAFKSFKSVSTLSDWELYWYRKAANMAGDEEKINKVKEEERRRRRTGEPVPLDDSVLPGIGAGSLKEID
jgi:molecular chaperone DnaK (HSP70)